MFKVLTGETKRRVISPATVTASVAAHLLVLGGVVYAAGGETTAPGPVREDTTIVWDADDPPPPPPLAAVEQPRTPPPAPDDPVLPQPPVTALEVPEVTEVPEVITPEPPGTPKLDPRLYELDGRRGAALTPPTSGPTAPEGGAGPSGPPTEYIPGEGDVEVRPVLDRDGLSRALERHYPPVLRDSRVSGRVLIEVIVDVNGRPRPGSARVIEASHPAFGDAALRAVDRFRFTPAKMMGIPVPVRVTIPIQWTAN
ncbi:MAG TPA: TonB family protein [Longimicrobium sp.]|nr:TonB family protein [Longimicrobium sp.]